MNLIEYKSTLKKNHKPRTVIFLVKDDNVLLGYKKSGFGKGYYLGIGGKVEENETVEEGALREFEEEVGVKIKLSALKKMAVLDFYFSHIPDESWNQQVHAYIVTDWEGEPKETEEIKPVWFNKDRLPLEEMWDDAKYWIPNILNGQVVYKEFLFDSNLKVIDHQNVNPEFNKFKKLISRLEDSLGWNINDIKYPPQGMDSQVLFVIDERGNEYVIKISKSANKDILAINLINQNSINIPLPKVITNFDLDDKSVLVMQKINDPLLEEVPTPQMGRYIPSMLKNLKKLHEIKSNKVGVIENNGQYLAWKQFVLSIFDGTNIDWEEVSNREGLDKDLILTSVDKI